MDKQDIFSINDEQAFTQACLKVFKFQAQNCSIYKKYIEGIKVNVDNITTVNQIPFLPIEFFKSHTITSNNNPADVIFTSSGTTGVVTSSHYVSDVNWYIESFRKAFTLFYGDISNYVLLALLPSYLERQGSSLIYMVKDLIEQSNHPDSGFFLYNHDDLYNKLKKQKAHFNEGNPLHYGSDQRRENLP